MSLLLDFDFLLSVILISLYVIYSLYALSLFWQVNIRIEQPMKSSQRLYVLPSLNDGARITLDPYQAHYLTNVLRLNLGSEVLLFNGHDGEWAALIISTSKKGGEVVCVRQNRAQNSVPHLRLAFAPVKGDRTDYIVEKATELGASVIAPIITDRTIVRKVNIERFRGRCIEAAEQCGRMSVPDVVEAQPLSMLFNDLSVDEILLFADEAGDAMSIKDALETKPSKVTLLIGPEGGFTDAERTHLRACDHVRPVSLGPRILRADTATFAGLALVQSVWGDWK